MSMKIKIKNVDQTVVRLWIISLFLEAYSFVNIGSYNVTVFTIVSVVSLIIGIYKIWNDKKRLTCTKIHIVAFCMMFYMLLNFLLTGSKNITSPLKGCFFFMVFLLSTRSETEEQFINHIRFFVQLLDIIALYGIYQYIARQSFLPFGDLIIEGHMVLGYNWTNSITMFGNNAFRSNSIFLEPSFFSQFLAINILFHGLFFLEGQNKKRHIFWIIISLFALLLTFSGTGLLILFFGGMLYLFQEREKKQLKRIFIIILIGSFLCAIVGYIALSTSVGVDLAIFFHRRITELTGARGVKVSGYIRFRSGFDVIKGIWSQSFLSTLIGGGMGSASHYNYLYGGTIDNSGYFKIAGELGIIGLSLYGVFLWRIWKANAQIRYRKMIMCVMIPMLACHEAFLQNYDWILLFMLNSIIVDDKYMEKTDDEKNALKKS